MSSPMEVPAKKISGKNFLRVSLWRTNSPRTAPPLNSRPTNSSVHGEGEDKLARISKRVSHAEGATRGPQQASTPRFGAPNTPGEAILVDRPGLLSISLQREWATPAPDLWPARCRECETLTRKPFKSCSGPIQNNTPNAKI